MLYIHLTFRQVFNDQSSFFMIKVRRCCHSHGLRNMGGSSKLNHLVPKKHKSIKILTRIIFSDRITKPNRNHLPQKPVVSPGFWGSEISTTLSIWQITRSSTSSKPQTSAASPMTLETFIYLILIIMNDCQEVKKPLI